MAQVWLETKAVDDAMQKWENEPAAMRESGVVDRHHAAARMLLLWYEPLRDASPAEEHQTRNILSAF